MFLFLYHHKVVQRPSSFLKAKFANPDPKFANVDSANENSPTNSANDQSVPAIAESKEKAGIPLAAESKNIDVVNAPSSRRDSEKTEQ